MSIGEKGICVRILEKELRIACPPNQESALRDAAQYLDSQMRKIRQTGRVIGLDRIAMMAALNITNELLTMRNRLSPAEENFLERIKELQDKIDTVLATQGYLRASVKEESLPCEKEKKGVIEETNI